MKAMVKRLFRWLTLIAAGLLTACVSTNGDGGAMENTIALINTTVPSAVAVAWQTTMNGVKWGTMGWEEQSCLVGGIVALWTGTMVAYFDKSMWRLEQNGSAPKP